MSSRKDKMEAILISDTEEREQKIHELIKGKETLNINIEEYKSATRGEKLSDRLADFCGSWRFLVYFAAAATSYMMANSILLAKPFDPFPFVFLNLLLACVASMQAPIIMMSQNREAKKDRIRAENDYLINLKSEIILEDLHLKIDELLDEQKRLKKQLENINIKLNDQNYMVNLKGDIDGQKYSGKEKH